MTGTQTELDLTAVIRPRQVDSVLTYLREHDSITHLEAEKHLGIMRLGARIKELRNLGYDIRTEMIPVKNRFDRTTHVARYSFAEYEEVSTDG